MKREAYSSNLSDSQWELVGPLVPPAKAGGRPRSVDMREILNGIFYYLKIGCQRRMLPHELPPWGPVAAGLRCWQAGERSQSAIGMTARRGTGYFALTTSRTPGTAGRLS